jgi:hypothetical protein
MSVHAEEKMVLRVPLQDGATFVRGTVVYADEHIFRIRFDEKWPGYVATYGQDTAGVELVSDG